ncbi:MAG: phosphoenolpyruvate carboxylase [Chitinophagaceae bacterium]
MTNTNIVQKFNDLVATKFQLYNSLFTSLPFHKIERTGILVSLLMLSCQDGFAEGLSPEQIIDNFINKQTNCKTEEEKQDLLFKFVQYIERQFVLFDAIEDAAFKNVNDIDGSGSLKQLNLLIDERNMENKLKEKLKDFKVRLVLTAHPTQFYPDNVLGIINDLSTAISSNNESHIYSYLKQLGRTPFFNKQKPTPYDEAVSLIWYLENIFYPASGKVISSFKLSYPDCFDRNNPIIYMGFWPGGDRDGNPFVTGESTLKVAAALRASILKCYYQEVRRMKRRLTFKNVYIELTLLESKLFSNLFMSDYQIEFGKKELLDSLDNIREMLINEHDGMFVDLVDLLTNKVEIFGLHFASLDIRQESSIHTKVINELNQIFSFLPNDYNDFNEAKKMELLFSLQQNITQKVDDSLANETLQSFAAIKHIQKQNGELGCNRYIISMCNKPLHIAEVYALFSLAGWDSEKITVDIVPLFETINDLQNAMDIMRVLYSNPFYKSHLNRRNNVQTVMLGFSDGTKDGGYLMANWSIYKAKEQLTALSNEYNIDIVFFDGRGGPPARGGGKTNKFYASLGNLISNKEIQLTIQGQTVSSNFGTIDRGEFNLEQLINAGVSNELFYSGQANFTIEQESLITTLSETSLDAYLKLKNHPNFVNYLQHASPLRFYTETNIGSRPAKRGVNGSLSLSDLRAIPFVGAWSQLKQNVTGYYGVGTALQEIESIGKWDEIKELYSKSLFLRTLFDNCEMAMMKCYFPLTAYLNQHPDYGTIWNMIKNEYSLTEQYILKLSNKESLMKNYPIDQLSIQMREKIVLPLTTIQQYALTKIRHKIVCDNDSMIKKSYEKLVMRCSFGIINAGRNSA